MTEIILEGLFLEREYEAIKDALEGRTYYNFKISCSKNVGQFNIIVSTELECDKKELERFFYRYAISYIFDLYEKFRKYQLVDNNGIVYFSGSYRDCIKQQYYKSIDKQEYLEIRLIKEED